MGKKRVSHDDAMAIRNRLRDFVKRRFSTEQAFWERTGVSRTTVSAWFRVERPSIPEVPHLLRLARATNVSLNWLLLGDWPELRQMPTTSSEDHLAALIESELKSDTEATPEELEEVWRNIVTYPADASGRNPILARAVEGVRPFYEAMLNRVRLTRELAGLAFYWNSVLLVSGGRGPDWQEAAQRKMIEQLDDLFSRFLPAFSVEEMLNGLVREAEDR